MCMGLVLSSIARYGKGSGTTLAEYQATKIEFSICMAILATIMLKIREVWVSEPINCDFLFLTLKHRPRQCTRQDRTRVTMVQVSAEG
jgi:hypothetical protein